MTDLAPFEGLVPLDHGLSVVVTRRADHTPQTTVVNAGVLPHPVTGEPRRRARRRGWHPEARATCAPIPPSRSSSGPGGSGPRSKAGPS